MKQLREVWRSCTSDNLETDDNRFVLIPLVAIRDRKGVMWSDLGALQMRRAELLITL